MVGTKGSKVIVKSQSPKNRLTIPSERGGKAFKECATKKGAGQSVKWRI